MSVDFVIKAQPRTDVGKGASRRLRRSGMVPAVIYGAHKEAQNLTVEHDTLIHQLESEAFYSSILTVELNGSREQVILRDLQRHPYKPTVLHMDLLRVSENEAIKVQVPIHFLNEDSCVGVKQEGGVLNRQVNEIEISCLPKHLPEYLEVDVGELSIGDQVHLSEIKLPEGVEIVQFGHGDEEAHDSVVVNVQPPQKAEIEESDEEPAAEPGEVPTVGDDQAAEDEQG